MSKFTIFRSETGLRDHLHDLNEAGTHPTAVGLDDLGRPFFVALVGAYGDREDVIFNSPWDGDIDYVDMPPRCEDCGAHSHGIEHLAFPVSVVVPT